MSKPTGKLPTYALWLLSAMFAILFGVAGMRLGQAAQFGAAESIVRGWVLLAIFGTCFIATAFIAVLRR